MKKPSKLYYIGVHVANALFLGVIVFLNLLIANSGQFYVRDVIYAGLSGLLVFCVKVSQFLQDEERKVEHKPRFGLFL